MTFIDHLEELRTHIIRSVVAILLMAAITDFHLPRLGIRLYGCQGPINPRFHQLRTSALVQFQSLGTYGRCTVYAAGKSSAMITNTFGGQFLGSISMALVGGIILAFPFIFWEFWRFVKPALKEKECKNTRFVIFWVSFFFFTGAAFGYFLLGPFTFNFLAGFQLGTQKGTIVTLPTTADYIR
jgi:sec-independent protein translocase protein TatC